MPKSYVAFKWSVYALATLLLFALQSVVLNHVRALGVTPFIYPMLPALVATTAAASSHRAYCPETDSMAAV